MIPAWSGSMGMVLFFGLVPLSSGFVGKSKRKSNTPADLLAVFHTLSPRNRVCVCVSTGDAIRKPRRTE